ncbi:hypothetical protein BG005_008399 [Podila minutissima]|nr:hypothetical protein BG005_008399 [Podila minutissima]
MIVPIVSFLVNLITTLLLFLVTIGDLATTRFYTSFHMMKATRALVDIVCSQVVFASGNGPQGGWLDKAYSFLTFGLWSFCEGTDNTIEACSDPKIGYTLDPIPVLHNADQQYVAEAVRSFNKVTVLYIPATCVALVALVLSFVSLWPRFRKRWIHAVATFLSLLVSIACVILMITVFTVYGSRKVQFEKHLISSPVKINLGPGVWITLALVPLTVFGALFGSLATCCPGRFQRRDQDDLPESKEDVAEPSA